VTSLKQVAPRPVSAAVQTARAGLPRPAPADIPAGTDTAANIRLIPGGGGVYLRTKHTGRRAVTRCTCLLSETRCTCLLSETRCTCLLRETRCTCLRGSNVKHPDQVPSLRAIRRDHVGPSITRVQSDVRYAPRAVQSGGGGPAVRPAQARDARRRRGRRVPQAADMYAHIHVCKYVYTYAWMYMYM
jgi:hypothetical protein